MPLNNMRLTRRRAIKALSISAASTLFPYTLLKGDNPPKPLHFVGLGSGGSQVLIHFQTKGIKARFTSVSQFRFPELAPEVNFIEFISPGKSIYHKAGKEIFREVDMTEPVSVPSSILDLFNEDLVFVLLAGLGGYTGTFMTQELVPWLSSRNKSFVSICNLPFGFEGKKKNFYAKMAVEMLQAIRGFTCFNPATIREKYGNLSIRKAFGKCDEELFRIYKDWKG